MTKRRQEKYITSGVRAVWFIRTTQKNKWDVVDYQNYEHPVFSIWLDKENHHLTASGAFSNCDSGDLFEVIQFFESLMNAAIQYSLKPHSSRFMQLAMNTVQYWKCRQPKNIIMDINYFIHYQDKLTKIGRLGVEQLSFQHREILNNPELLQKYTYGYIIQRFSKIR